MDINKYLQERHPEGRQFHAVIISIDIVGNRSLVGTDEQKQRTKAAIRDLLELTIADRPMAILSWRGDGGLIIADVDGGFSEVIGYCDQVVGLIPLINRSRGIYNYLPYDNIRFRIVCNYDVFTSSGDPAILSKSAIDNLFTKEKEVGVVNHVVVVREIWRNLVPELQDRFSPLPHSGTDLGQCYVLDGDLGQVNLELNRGASEQLKLWLSHAARSGKYNELLIFSYTNESLFNFISGELPNLDVKILMRNWIVEAEEEKRFNELRNPASTMAALASAPKARWKKFHTIRVVADALMDSDPIPGFAHVDIRFYSEAPLFKGAILRGEDSRMACIGLYAWDPDREAGGSPYWGENWSSAWITDSGGAERRFIVALASRFDELWKSGRTYDEMLQEEADRNKSHEKNVEKLFSMDGRPYLIMYPGRYTSPNRVLPDVASEDMASAHLVKDMLEDLGAKVTLAVVTDNDYPDKVKEWDDHVICLCLRSVFQEGSASRRTGFEDIEFDNLPYWLRVGQDGPTKLYMAELHKDLCSPLDEEPDSHRDYCLIVNKKRRNGARFFFIAGLHAIGTWGGATFLTNKQSLAELATNVQEDHGFTLVLSCNFTVPDRNIYSKIVSPVCSV